MGVAYYIVLDKEDVGFDPFVNGKFIARDATRIDRIAKLLGLPTLDDYFSQDPEEAAAALEELGIQAEPAKLPQEIWFDPEEGLQWVASIQDHVKANPDAVRDVAGVLSDLREYTDVLTKAKAVGAMWYFAVDF